MLFNNPAPGPPEAKKSQGFYGAEVFGAAYWIVAHWRSAGRWAASDAGVPGMESSFITGARWQSIPSASRRQGRERLGIVPGLVAR